MSTNDLSGVSGHSPGHHPLQVAAQTHSLYSDDGLLGQDGAEDEEQVAGVFLIPLCFLQASEVKAARVRVTYNVGLLGCGL